MVNECRIFDDNIANRKIEVLKSGFHLQQSLLRNISTELEAASRARFHIAPEFANRGEPFTDVETKNV